MGIRTGTSAERRGSTPFDSGFGYDFGDPAMRRADFAHAQAKAQEEAVVRMMGGTGMPAQLVVVSTVPYGGLNEPTNDYAVQQAVDSFMRHKPA